MGLRAADVLKEGPQAGVCRFAELNAHHEHSRGVSILPDRPPGSKRGCRLGAATVTKNPRDMAGTPGRRANRSPHSTHAGAEEGAKRASDGDAGFEEVDHPPQPIRFTALDDFQRFQPAEGVVRRLEPDRQRVRRDEFGERLE